MPCLAGGRRSIESLLHERNREMVAIKNTGKKKKKSLRAAVSEGFLEEEGF